MSDADQIITDAQRLDETNDALSLEEALVTIWGHGFADDQAGDVDTIGHAFRVGRFILETDSQGFRTVHEYDSEDRASDVIDAWEGEDA